MLRLAGVCPPDVRVALIGESREITFYRELMEIGITEYLPKPLTRDMVMDQLRPKLLGDVASGQADRGGHVISICGAQGGGAWGVGARCRILLPLDQRGGREYAVRVDTSRRMA